MKSIIGSAIITLVLFANAMASTEQSKQIAIDNGLGWLDATQTISGVEGYWAYGSDGTLAATAAAALALVEEGNWEPGAPHYAATMRALRYVFNRAAVDGRFGIENAVYTRYAEDYNNDGNFNNDGGNDQAIYFEPGNSARRVYTTGIVVPLVYALGEALGRDTVIGMGSPAVSGLTYAQLMQDLIDWFCWAQVEPNMGVYRGGWRYDANYGSADNSTAQWGALPILYAADWGLGVPTFVRTELALWADYVQNDASGGSGYDSPTNLVNISKTGGLILEFAVVGRPLAHASVQAALGYINAHWNEPVSGWDGNINNAYAMWALYKGLQVYGLTDYLLYGPGTEDDVMCGIGVPAAPGGFTIGQDWDPVLSVAGDWYAHYSDYLCCNQNGDGSWSGAESWIGALATGWYINILNATGAPPDLCVMARIEEPAYISEERTVPDPFTNVRGPSRVVTTRQLVVPISMAAVDGKEAITGIDLIFNYDPLILAPTGVSFVGSMLEGLGWGHMYNVPTPGEVRVGLAGTTPLPGDGILLFLKFDVASTAPCDGVSLLDLYLLLNEGEPCVNYAPDSWDSWAIPLAEVEGGIRFWGCGMVGNDNPPIPDVEVEIASAYQTRTAVSDEDGVFLLEACFDSCYTMTPSKACGETEGISPLDAALVLRHFVGLEELEECPIAPMEMYDGSFCPAAAVEPQKVAADVSGNGSIHSFDASIILKYLVGQSTAGYRVGCWTFYCDSRDFCVDADPMEYQDFVGLLYGDVSGNYGLTFPGALAPSTAAIAAGTVHGEVGQTIEVPVTLVGADGYFGLAFAVSHAPEFLSVEGVIPSAMASGCLMEWRAESGAVRIAAASTAGITGDGEFCRIVYRVNAMPPELTCPLDLAEARADERPELMTMIDGAITAGVTGVDGSVGAVSAYRLYPPTPNPLNPMTTIRFAIPPAGGVAAVDIYDSSGRLVNTLHTGFATGGIHSAVWSGVDNRGEEVASGTYFVRLHAPGYDQTQKLTIVK